MKRIFNTKRATSLGAQQLRRQSGFSLFFTLIALAILLVAMTAIMRSSGRSLFSSGNQTFTQDMVLRGDLVNVRVYALFRPGGALNTPSILANNNKNNNYSAVALPANAQGIPMALINDASFTAVGQSTNDIIDATSNTRLRYVIERLCDLPGDAMALGVTHCVRFPDPRPILGGSSTQANVAFPAAFAPIYRVTVRIQGPRGSETYLQNTFLKSN